MNILKMKAQAGDLLIPITVFFSLLILGVLAAQILVDFRDSADFTGAGQQVLNDGITYYQKLDVGLVIVFISLVMINAMLAFVLNTHPIFLVIQILVFLLLFFYPVILQDVWDEFKVDPSLASGISVFPYSSLLVDNLVYAYMGSIFLWFAAFFIKLRFSDPSGGGGGNQFF